LAHDVHWDEAKSVEASRPISKMIRIGELSAGELGAFIPRALLRCGTSETATPMLKC
jgi:hypothetical protein